MATFGTFTSGQVLTAAELNTAGEYQTYTPTWTQSATITKTVDWARYTQLNKLVVVSVKMTATGGGTAGNNILIGLPVNASANNFVMGVGFSIPVSSGTNLPNVAVFNSSSTVKFTVSLANQSTGFSGSTAVASGDIWYVNLTYEAA